MRRLHSLTVWALVGLGGCAGNQLRREPVGQRAALVQARGQAEVAPDAGASIQLTRGRYEVALRFDVPRAQVVDYTIACGANEQRGRVGETFEAYRTRRLAELNRQQDRDRAAAASAARMVTGVVAPAGALTGQAVVAGPQGTAAVETTVSAHSVRDAAGGVAGDAFPPITELAVTDVGAGQLQARATVMVPVDATCVVRALADDDRVRAAYDVTRVRDLAQEARERQLAATTQAREVRVQLTARLVASGADPLARERRLEAEARARAEEQARLAELHAAAEAERRRNDAEVETRRAEVRAAAEIELRQRQAEQDARRAAADAERARIEELERQRALTLRLEVQARLELALEVRGSLVAYLAGTCNADPHKRARERATALRLREERELKLRLEVQARLDLEARLRAERELKLHREREAREAAARRRMELALGARVELVSFLETIGARQRPPMPALLVETPGSAPFDGARWSAGRWEWNRGEWVWIRGGWMDATVFGDAGRSGPAVVTTVEVAPVIVAPPAIEVAPPTIQVSVPATVRVTTPPPPPPVTTTTTTTTTTTVTVQPPTVRDHRTGRPPPPAPRAPSTAPTVRDHRKRGR